MEEQYVMDELNSRSYRLKFRELCLASGQSPYEAIRAHFLGEGEAGNTADHCSLSDDELLDRLVEMGINQGLASKLNNPRQLELVAGCERQWRGVPITPSTRKFMYYVLDLLENLQKIKQNSKS